MAADPMPSPPLNLPVWIRGSYVHSVGGAGNRLDPLSLTRRPIRNRRPAGNEGPVTRGAGGGGGGPLEQVGAEGPPSNHYD